LGSKEDIFEFIKKNGKVSKNEVVKKFINKYSLATINVAISELKYLGKIKSKRVGRGVELWIE